MNLRKAGQLTGQRSRRTTFEDDDYRFAAEMATRHLERRDRVTLDDVLCDPVHVSEFDALAAKLAPGYSSLEYRWSALKLRKQRHLPPEIISHAVPALKVSSHAIQKLRIDEIATNQGLYVFFEPNQALYVGEASNLRIRLKKHLEHSDNKGLAQWIWAYGSETLRVEIHELPGDTNTRVRRALETELIRTRQPIFNVIGRIKA